MEETPKLERVQMELRYLGAARVLVTSGGCHINELHHGHWQHLHHHRIHLGHHYIHGLLAEKTLVNLESSMHHTVVGGEEDLLSNKAVDMMVAEVSTVLAMTMT